MNTPSPASVRSLAVRLAAAFLMVCAVRLAEPAVHAQPTAAPGAVVGTIVKSDHTSGISGLAVTVSDTGQAASTDSAGHFRIDGVVPGPHALLVTGSGYSRLRIENVAVLSSEVFDVGAQAMPAVLQNGQLQAGAEVTVNASNQIETMEKITVVDQTIKPFTTANMDIPRGQNDVQPYYFFNADQIDSSGAINVEDFLKTQLTMDTNAVSDSQIYLHNNNNGDTSTISLNGLPALQTLILVNGQRQAGVSVAGTDYQPNINGIPTASIDHIEVLPSSASAIYGANALGGVVNIILKKNYQGGEIRYTYDNTANTDAPRRSTDFTYGMSLEGGKTQITITANYATIKPLEEEDRLGLSQRGVATILKNFPTFFSSAGAFQGETTNVVVINAAETNPATGTAYAAKSSLFLQNGTALNATSDFISPGTTPGTSTAALNASLIANAGQENYQYSTGFAAYGLKNQIGTQPQTKSFGFQIHRDMTPWLQAFASFRDTSLYTTGPDNEVGGEYIVYGNAPENPFANNVEINIPANATTPAAWDQSLNNVHNAGGGLIAKLPHDWTAEADFTWSENLYSLISNTFDTTKLQTALGNGSVDPFVDPNVAPQNWAQFTVPSFAVNLTTLNDTAFRFNGPLFSFPWGSPRLTIGLEHRKEGRENEMRYTLYPNPVNDLTYFFLGQDDIANSAYAELEIPLVTEKNAMPFIRDFEIQLSGRDEFFTVRTNPVDYLYAPQSDITGVVSGYSSPLVHATTKYSSANPTMGFKYKPVEDLTIRASTSTAFLPPTYGQLVPNPAPTAPTSLILDPANPALPPYDVATLTGGNPNLRPQTSRQVNIGAIYQPEKGLLTGFRADLEFHELWEHNVITTPTAQFILNNSALYADRITRGSNGLITNVDITNLNLYSYRTDGYDLTLNYLKDTPWGRFNLNVLASITEHFKEEVSPTLPMLEYVGFVHVAGGAPLKTKGNSTLTWSRGRVSLGITGHYYDSFKQYGSPGDPVYNNVYPAAPTNAQIEYVRAQGSNSVQAETYYDIFGSYSFARRSPGTVGYDLLNGLSISAGIKDVFNTTPPFDAYAWSVYYYAPFGDIRLRDYWIAIRKTF